MKSEGKQQRGAKLILYSSCAGCAWHDLDMASGEYQTIEGVTLFNHWCLNDRYQEFVGIVPSVELTARLAPPQPSWCKEERPVITI